MRTIYIPFSCTIFKVSFEDVEFAKNFERVFNTIKDPSGSVNHTIAICGCANKGYDVMFDGLLIGRNLKRDKAAYSVTRVFGDKICSHAQGDICVMHAASVLLGDKMVSFSGASGAGKTSLALFFSRYGIFAGDEYAYLNIKTGEVWHERHPYQLKAKNTNLLQYIDAHSLLTVEEDPSQKAFFVSHPTLHCTGLAIACL